MAVLLGGRTLLILDVNSPESGSAEKELSVESDTILVSLHASTVSGTLSVRVVTLADTGKETEVFRFPDITSATSDLLLRKAAVVLSRVRVEAFFTGPCVFEVRGRGIGTGEASVRIVGSSNGRASQITVPADSTLPLIPVSLSDRAGIAILNNGLSGRLFLGFTSAEATEGTGYPLGPGQSLGIDLAAGGTLWAHSPEVDTDVRILEAGA